MIMRLSLCCFFVTTSFCEMLHSCVVVSSLMCADVVVRDGWTRVGTEAKERFGEDWGGGSSARSERARKPWHRHGEDSSQSCRTTQNVARVHSVSWAATCVTFCFVAVLPFRLWNVFSRCCHVLLVYLYMREFGLNHSHWHSEWHHKGRLNQMCFCSLIHSV